MSIGRDDVLRAARLAEIGVNEPELDRLVAQLGRIVGYVEQLDELVETDASGIAQTGPDQVRLREDVVRRTPLAHRLSELAPEFVDGFFLVPARGTMEEEA